ncbi:hypothetical protein ABB37_03782 [Leptomonas pyrrhocoris]|uniref:Uncharacterized protein n=1 Tax=Leptomonas pyrrhocoris TaxID=157538 RepID=A0A0N0VFT1_LEPPY|nr:hypothetical protein ABB37_03782 [Leptomonas pyrrhocoris]KPA81408.1 hypothetical protein ABB37_03782 [Leptomonas pyrrhocoris]|eukprot:XP_015659847.1 hypothetical protein ABB37_03782 [Leptomonas pyrrhocoris]
MANPSLLERYFAQCQAHRMAPLPDFVASLRDGVMKVNLADVSLADIRLFASAVTDTMPSTAAVASPVLPRERRRGGNAGSTQDHASSASSAAGQAAIFFTTLHFSFDPSSSRQRQQQSADGGRGAGRGVSSSSSAPASVSLLLAPQSESTLRWLMEAVGQLVRDSARTLKSFAWCGLPVVAPSRGARSAVLGALSFTQLLPLCRHIKRLNLDGVALSRAQFMQLVMINFSSSSTDVGEGPWMELEEASFVNCGVTDACKGGIVRLIRVGLPMKTAQLYFRSLRKSVGNSAESPLSAPLPLPAATISAGTSAMRGLRHLDLSQNPLGDETARAIATAITGSSLHTLRLASTAVTERGAAVLLLPSVLEENAVEMLDLSSTPVSDAYEASAVSSSSSPAADLRLLAASSIATGFRVVARGMGQLLVLREAKRLSQQPGDVRTPTATTAATTAPSSAPRRATTTAAAHTTTDRQSIVRASSRERAERADGEDGQLSPDSFDDFVRVACASFAPPPSRVTPVAQKRQPSPPQQPQQPQPAVAAPPTAASPDDTPASAPFPSPPPLQPCPPLQPPFTAAAAAAQSSGATAPNTYGPWWPAMASWYAMQHPYPGVPDGLPGMPIPVPVPVPVPIPVLAPMPAPYTPAALGTIPWSGAAFAQAAAASSTAAAVGAGEGAPERKDGGASLAKSNSAFKPAEHNEKPKDNSTAAAALASSLHEVTEAVGDIAGVAEDVKVSKVVEREERATEEAATPLASSLADDAVSTHLTRQASDAAGGSSFLAALITRLEAHETDVSERLEQQYQRTTSQLTALEKDMRFRLQQMAEAERKERATAAERQTALLEAIAALHEAPVKPASETMSEEMLSQLAHLIEVGMKRVHAALENDGAEKTTDEKLEVKAAAAPVSAPTAAEATERDTTKAINQRLKQLGW